MKPISFAGTLPERFIKTERDFDDYVERQLGQLKATLKQLWLDQQMDQGDK